MTYNLDICAQCQRKWAHGKYCDVETARTSPGARLWCVLHMHAKLFQSHPTLCNPRDCSPPGFSVHGISQARILE